MPKPFCKCGHSYWSHRVGWCGANGRKDSIWQEGLSLRNYCESGNGSCRCIEFTARPAIPACESAGPDVE